ncbi:MAG TPA: ROK family protein [Ohtaekwangia sp.]|nr:ROK family protein [Ohtaekwangia sp.]
MLLQNEITTDDAVVGIDIGGTHISAALVNLKTRALVPNSLRRRDVDSGSEANELIRHWSEIIQEVAGTHNPKSTRIGIAMPGPFDYDEGVSMIKDQGKFKALYGLNVKELLAQHLTIEKNHIRMMNDAACFLSGEVFSGAAREYDRAIGITLGTGLGSATYNEGETQDAGLWEHPFKASIAEDYISTRWFVRRYQEICGHQLKGVKELLGYTKTDVRAVQIFEEFGRNLGEFLSSFVVTHKPQVIVIGGNISHASDVFLPEVQKVLRTNAIDVPVRMTALGENACVIGAASTWLEKHVAQHG